MLAIIGGTGIYQLEGLTVIRERHLETPFGAPSAPVVEGRLGDTPLLFLPRHGAGHRLLPSEINYRANIWALKKAGATRVLGLSAVGSLRREIAPGDLAVPAQYFDFIKGPRHKTFFGEGLVAHVSTAEPTCRQLSRALAEAGEGLERPIHQGKTYACVDGPRLGTRAESLFLRDAANCDLVGMTNVPEVFLAREAQLCYATLSITTDYDCWMDDPAQHVSVEQVIARYGASLERAKGVVKALAERWDGAQDCTCRHSLDSAVLTPRESLNEAQQALLNLLRR
ncbi:S-methyl-5'-thioadenosine phosphorylase [Motiliproteus sp. SC1-56]|uniref:S-methyl-5'-thioadenosine phosphorylase n=1 Tax=Motiliproteus sp. SC1-56 TaxID=2799565 RepID=UPI001A8E4607